MRTVRFDPAGLQGDDRAWWDKWQARADKARAAALKEWVDWIGQPPPPDGMRAPFRPGLQPDIWSELKHWLNEHVFDHHCAYCEGPLETDRYQGDAEHFRPKGSVVWRDAQGQQQRARCALSDGTQIDHPGYFWLAYDWRNLVPACAFCNSGKGKNDQFPVAAQHQFHVDGDGAGIAADAPPDEALEAPPKSRRYFLAPLRLDALESPLLLNPLNPPPGREASRHLRYGLGGTVVAVDGSPLGQRSIEVYQLRRDTLQRRRQKEQEAAHRAYYAALLDPDVSAQARADTLQKQYEAGQHDHSSAVLDYLRERVRLQAQRMAG